MSIRRNLIERYRQRTLSFQASDRVAVIEDGPVDAIIDVKKPKGCLSLNISVEPLLFSLIFIHTFSHGVLLNLLERNVCVQTYKLTALQCSSSDYVNSTMKSHLEGAAAEVNLAISLIQGLCPVALSLFVGPWSDKNGRKPFIILPFAGYFLYFLLWGIISVFPNVPIKYMLIPSVPLSLTGGMVSVVVCCYCYLCDIFDAETRTLRFNIAMSAFLAGGLLANFTVFRIYEAAGEYGYILVFLICSMVAALSFLYAWICLDETIEKIEGKAFIFSWENAKSVFTVLLMRPTGELIIILLTVVILVSEILVKSGESSIEFLVGKSQFSWALNNYTRFSSYNTIIAVMSSVLGSLIMKRFFRCENTTIILISSISLAVAEVFRGFSEQEDMYWISSGLTKTGALIGPTIAAEMSNVVNTEDLGKVYAFNALVESGSAYLSAPLYTALYKHLLPVGETLHIYFLSAGISTIIIFAAIFLMYNNRRFNQDIFHVNY